MKMKLVGFALLATILTSNVAFGTECGPTFYIGGEAQYNYLNDKLFNRSNGFTRRELNKHAPGLGLFAGTRLNEYFGAEVGASIFRGHDIKVFEYGFVGANLKNRHYNVYGDLVGYLPVNPELDLIASVGVGYLTSKLTANATVFNQAVASASVKTQKVGARAGAGFQYKVAENVGTRLMAHYQKGNAQIKDVASAGLSLFYQF